MTRPGINGPIILFFAATGGGVQITRVRVANILAKRGYEVHCVMPEANGPHLQALSPEVRLVDLGTRKPWGVVAALSRYIKATDPFAIMASQQHTIIAAIWARWLSRRKIRLVISQHNTLSAICRQHKKLALVPFMAKCFYRYADEIIAVSNGVADDLAVVAGLPRERITVVYNAVVTDDMLKAAGEATGHPWFDEKDRPIVLGVGNLTKVKDFPTLLRAFRSLRERVDARLVILGEGPERAALEKEIAAFDLDDQVALLGFTDNPYAFMARSDVFVLSSAVEGFGNVVVEALACGCPVVSTDCPSGPAEILAAGDFGPLVEIGDDRAMADAISRTLEAPIDATRLKGRAAAFSADRAVDQYLDLLRA